MTEGIPVDVLEKRAADERRQLHNSVQELRETVHERLDVKRNVRNHLGTISGVMAVAGLALGSVSAVAELSARGVQFLKTPESYYDDVPERMHRWAARSLTAHLDKLVAEGAVRAERAGYTLVQSPSTGRDR